MNLGFEDYGLIVFIGADIDGSLVWELGFKGRWSEAFSIVGLINFDC